MNNEFWVDIKGYKGLYQVSSYGRIQTLRFKTIKILKTSKPKGKSIRTVKLTKGGLSKQFSVNKIIRDHFKEHKSVRKYMLFDVENIVNEVSNYFEVSFEEIVSRKRGKVKVSIARQIAHKLTKDTTKLSLFQIGSQIGRRHHSDILNSIKTINNLIDTDKEIKRDYYHLLSKIENRIDTPITKRLEELIPL